MFAQVIKLHVIRQVLLHEVGGCLREENLPVMPGVHEASSLLHIRTNIAFGGQQRFASMQADAYAHGDALGPGMIGEGTLHSNGSRNSVGGACEGYKEGIPLHIYLIAVILIENRA